MQLQLGGLHTFHQGLGLDLVPHLGPQPKIDLKQQFEGTDELCKNYLHSTLQV